MGYQGSFTSNKNRENPIDLDEIKNAKPGLSHETYVNWVLSKMQEINKNKQLTSLGSKLDSSITKYIKREFSFSF